MASMSRHSSADAPYDSPTEADAVLLALGGSKTSRRAPKRRFDPRSILTLIPNSSAEMPLKADTNAGPKGLNPKPLRACYTFGPVLGIGAYAAVRSAVDVHTGARVAVKVFFTNKKSARATALNEIALLQQLNHTSVIRFVEYFEEQQGIFLVTELVSGRDAETCLFDRGSYAEEDCRTIARQLLRTLEYLHGRGVAHRDLKLSNVVLGENDCVSSLKLVDFGLAEKLTHDEPHFSVPCGTPRSTAPEVLSNDARYGTSCDLWSLGCLIFTLLSGEPPFGSANGIRGLVLQIRRGEYSMADPAWQLVSEGARDFVKSLLTVNPVDRPTASEAMQHPWLQE